MMINNTKYKHMENAEIKKWKTNCLIDTYVSAVHLFLFVWHSHKKVFYYKEITSC